MCKLDASFFAFSSSARFRISTYCAPCDSAKSKASSCSVTCPPVPVHPPTVVGLALDHFEIELIRVPVAGSLRKLHFLLLLLLVVACPKFPITLFLQQAQVTTVRGLCALFVHSAPDKVSQVVFLTHDEDNHDHEKLLRTGGNLARVNTEPLPWYPFAANYATELVLQARGNNLGHFLHEFTVLEPVVAHDSRQRRRKQSRAPDCNRCRPSRMHHLIPTLVQPLRIFAQEMRVRWMVKRDAPPIFKDSSAHRCVLHNKKTAIHNCATKLIVKFLSKQNLLL
mmetsp:Transcript_75033/g.200152  ORF Transcript_75033/g.200152 Transcript_75033/m.200152 type:complete len:281 (-) Transcript_75033:161-1003(-)